MGNQPSSQDDKSNKEQLSPLNRPEERSGEIDVDKTDKVNEKHTSTDVLNSPHKTSKWREQDVAQVKQASDVDKKNDMQHGSKTVGEEKKEAAPRKRGEEISVEIVGKDDIDAASTYSLFMDRKDFRYYFQHPYLRLLFAYLIVFFNFLIYAEDPVAHSRKECLIPMIGNDFSFVTNRYPPNAWSFLKVVLWLTGLIIGLFVGKLCIHGYLFSKYKNFFLTGLLFPPRILSVYTWKIRCKY